MPHIDINWKKVSAAANIDKKIPPTQPSICLFSIQCCTSITSLAVSNSYNHTTLTHHARAQVAHKLPYKKTKEQLAVSERAGAQSASWVT